MDKHAKSIHTLRGRERIGGLANPRGAVALCCLVALAAFASEPPKSSANPHLVKAQHSADDLRYAEALNELKAAWNTPGNDHDTIAQILTLQGIVCASVGQREQAKSFFKALLYLRPDATLPAELGPKITGPFFEMKGRMSSEEALRFQPLPGEADALEVKRVSAKVASDPEQLAKTVRFHVRADDGYWQSKDVTLANAVASHDVSAPSVEWWAELLGERQESLAVVGSPDNPLRAARRPVLAPAPDSLPSPAKLPPPVTTSRSNLRPLAYGLLAGGGASLLAAGVFGLQANQSRTRIDQATRDEQGRITGLSQRDALALDADVRRGATATNVALVGGAALLAAGATVFFVFPGGNAAISPAANGLSATGVFP